MKDGFLPIIIKVENRLAYYEALNQAHTINDYSDFIALVEREVEDSLDLYLMAIHQLSIFYKVHFTTETFVCPSEYQT